MVFAEVGYGTTSQWHLVSGCSMPSTLRVSLDLRVAASVCYNFHEIQVYFKYSSKQLEIKITFVETVLEILNVYRSHCVEDIKFHIFIQSPFINLGYILYVQYLICYNFHHSCLSMAKPYIFIHKNETDIRSMLLCSAYS